MKPNERKNWLAWYLSHKEIQEQCLQEMRRMQAEKSLVWTRDDRAFLASIKIASD